MIDTSATLRRTTPATLLTLLMLTAGALAQPSQAKGAQPAPAMPITVPVASAYHPIQPIQRDRVVVLDGHDLTIEQLIAVARDGARVQVTPEAQQRMADAYGLLLEGSTEGVSIYWFNRGAGGQREVVLFAGDPESAENKPKVLATQMRAFQGGAKGGYGPEVADEEVVRAMMVVRANAMIYNAPSPGLARMLVDLINRRITPVVQSRGTVGEGDLGPLMNVGGAMVGAGEVYLNGVRMTAAQALAHEGLTPLLPFGADNNALSSSNAYGTAQAALLVSDARELLQWADLVYAMDLNGMNSSVSPLSTAVQADRPDRWLNWDAGRVNDMLRGSYLYQADPKRIIQDPESLRASSVRQASAWKAWAALRDTVVFQMNTSDHNPVVKVGLQPTDSWEMATPQMMQFHVKGGPQSRGKSGYILSNANWDPYPMANEVEAFSIAVANMSVNVVQRMQRFSNPFFTVVRAQEFLPRGSGFGGGGYTPVDLWQEIQSLEQPITPEGNAGGDGVEELQAQTRLKTARARLMVDDALNLLGFDLNNAARWMDVRKLQDPGRAFGVAPTAVWAAYRKVQPLEAPVEPRAAYQFLKSNSASGFYSAGPAIPNEPTVSPVRW